jgi:hypothetical protein
VGPMSRAKLARQSAVGPVIAALLLALPHFAIAESPAAAPAAATTTPGEVLVILAGDEEGPIDPDLSTVRALQVKPFNGYKSFKILAREGLKLLPGQAEEIALPASRKLRITLLERRKDGRFKVQVSINRPNKTDYLPLLEVAAKPGERFFVAGQKYQGGTILIGVRVGELPTHK